VRNGNLKYPRAQLRLDVEELMLLQSKYPIQKHRWAREKGRTSPQGLDHRDS
jgi:hypothetical protein